MTGRGKVCQNESLKCGMTYMAATHWPSSSIHGVFPSGVCTFLESYVGVSECFTLKQPASHGLYSKTQSMLSSSLKTVLALHSYFWNPFIGKTLQTLIAIGCYTGSVPLSFLFLHFYYLLSAFLPLTLLPSFETSCLLLLQGKLKTCLPP